jgi:diguanylate cyclase (GGDEF)-like protein
MEERSTLSGSAQMITDKPANISSSDERRDKPEAQQQIGKRRTPEQQRSTKRAFLDRLKQEFFYDILRARSHSKHFRHTRALSITNRVRSLALILAVLIPAWIAVDALYLPQGDTQAIALLRMFTGAACFGLFFWSRDNHDLTTARFKLALLVIIPSLFHTASQALLLEDGQTTLPAGYHFFPFLILSLGAIFPLTIIEGAFLAVFVVGLYITTALVKGDLLSLASLNDVWLLALLAMIAGWAALTQLTMMMRLYRQAHRDPLTGLANRRSIINFLEREVEYSRDIGVPLSVILMDLDKFKRINDTHGHAIGDVVLQSFAGLLTSQSRNEDLVGRYGGEEFLMILSATAREDAVMIAERLRQSCTEQRIDLDDDEPLSFSTSAGVTALRPGESIDEMMKRVDDALYNAKGGGRNRVVAA